MFANCMSVEDCPIGDACWSGNGEASESNPKSPVAIPFMLLLKRSQLKGSVGSSLCRGFRLARSPACIEPCFPDGEPAGLIENALAVSLSKNFSIWEYIASLLDESENSIDAHCISDTPGSLVDRAGGTTRKLSDIGPCGAQPCERWR